MNTHIVPTGFEVKAQFRRLVMQIERQYETRMTGADRETVARLKKELQRKIREEKVRFVLQRSRRKSWVNILR